MPQMMSCEKCVNKKNAIAKTYFNKIAFQQDAYHPHVDRIPHHALCRGGVCSGGCLFWRGVCPQGGVCSWLVYSRGCLLCGECLIPGGVSPPRGGVCPQGVSALLGCVCLLPGGLLLGGVCPLGGVCSGGCLLLGGVCSEGPAIRGDVSALGEGVWYPSMHSPVNRMTGGKKNYFKCLDDINWNIINEKKS